MKNIIALIVFLSIVACSDNEKPAVDVNTGKDHLASLIKEGVWFFLPRGGVLGINGKWLSYHEDGTGVQRVSNPPELPFVTDFTWATVTDSVIVRNYGGRQESDTVIKWTGESQFRIKCDDEERYHFEGIRVEDFGKLPSESFYEDLRK